MLLSSYRIPFLIPYFVEMQRKSFLNFLNTGLNYEITKKNPMYVCFKQFKITFYPEAYKLSIPEYTSKTAILKFQTYASKLYIPVEFTNSTTKELKLQWILLGTLPLMTKRGHFIVNGCPRVIVNQIVRSPGIYYKIIYDEKKRKSYYGDLISQRGAWLRFEIDKKKRVWVKIKKSRKIPILIFLKALGISDVKLEQLTKYTDFLEISKQETENIESTDYFHPSSVEDSLMWIYGFVYPEKKEKGQVTLKKAKKFLLQKFFNHGTYDLGDSGRSQLNQKFNLKISKNILVLTPHDLLCAIDYLIKLEQGIGITDDIDDLKNRRVRTSGELLQNQVGTGFIRLEKFIKNKTENPTFNVSKIFSSKPIDSALREFFGSSPLSQFMDQTNPLAELTHKRRISSLGPGGVSRETAGMQVRGIHASHYGRICPIETPEGRNAGLVNSLTTLARINKQGFIETPFYNVYQGQIQKFGSTVLLSATHESQISIAASDLQTNYFYFLPYRNIPARAYGEFQTLARHKIQYMSVSPIQMISIATSLIPFLEHDDANRALMGSNMQRQAVPLILPERPIVGTGLETRIISDSGHGLQANTSGIVVHTSSKNIDVKIFPERARPFEPKFSVKSYLSANLLKKFVFPFEGLKNFNGAKQKTKFFFKQHTNSNFGKSALSLGLSEKKLSFFQGKRNSLGQAKQFKYSGFRQTKQPKSQASEAGCKKTSGQRVDPFRTKFLVDSKNFKFFQIASDKNIPKQKKRIKNMWIGFTKSNQIKTSIEKNILDVSNFNKNPTNLENLNFMPCIKSQLVNSPMDNSLLQSKHTLNFFTQNNILSKKQTLGFKKRKFNVLPTWVSKTLKLQKKMNFDSVPVENIKPAFKKNVLAKFENDSSKRFFKSNERNSLENFVLKTDNKNKIKLSEKVTINFDYFFLGFYCINFNNLFYNSDQRQILNLNNGNYWFKSGAENVFRTKNLKKFSYLPEIQQIKKNLGPTGLAPSFFGSNRFGFSDKVFFKINKAALDLNLKKVKQKTNLDCTFSFGFNKKYKTKAKVQSIKFNQRTLASPFALDYTSVQFREIYMAKTHFLGLPLKSKIKINNLQLIAIQTNLNLKTNKIYFINSIPYTKNIDDILQMFWISNKVILKKPEQLRKNLAFSSLGGKKLSLFQSCFACLKPETARSSRFGPRLLHLPYKKQNFWSSIQLYPKWKNYFNTKFYAKHQNKINLVTLDFDKQNNSKILQIPIHKNLKNPKQFQWCKNSKLKTNLTKNASFFAIYKFKFQDTKKKLEWNTTNVSHKISYIYRQKPSSNFLKNTRDFIKEFVKECMELVFTQIFIKKKNLKHIFFFNSIHWENFQNQKSLPVRFFKKTLSSNFFKVSRFTSNLTKRNFIVKKKTAYKKYYIKNILKTYSLVYNQDIQNIVSLNKKSESNFIFHTKIKKLKYFFSEYQEILGLKKTIFFATQKLPSRENRIKNLVSGKVFLPCFLTQERFDMQIKAYENYQIKHKIMKFIRKKNKISTLKFLVRYIPFETIQTHYYLKKLHIKSSYFYKKNSLYGIKNLYYSISSYILPNVQTDENRRKNKSKFGNFLDLNKRNNSIFLYPIQVLLPDAEKKENIHKVDLTNLNSHTKKIQKKIIANLGGKKLNFFQGKRSSLVSQELGLAVSGLEQVVPTSGQNLKNENKVKNYFTKSVLSSKYKQSSATSLKKTLFFPTQIHKTSLNCLGQAKLLKSRAASLAQMVPTSGPWGIETNLKTQSYILGPYQHSNQNTCLNQVPLVSDSEWIQKGDLLTDGSASVGGELALGKSISVAYMPWEGYNFEDAILVSERLIYDDLYTSIHIEKYTTEISDTQYGREQITASINVPLKQLFNLDKDGIIKSGTWVNQGDILVGKLTPIRERKLSGHEKLLSDVLGMKKNVSVVKDTSLRVPKYISGRVVHIERLKNDNISSSKLESSSNNSSITPSRVHIYIAEKKRVQVGDKMSGRHGNKGIISKILPRQDMPYLADGTPIDMVLNPLGVPSRMNVGQIFECLLGLAAKELNQQFKISCFDEMNGAEASRSFTYSKLFEARVKTGKRWLFNPNYPGKMKLFDGRTGECFHQNVTVGKPYMLKLIHLVDEKIHARSTGPYSLVTQQPVRGRSKQGGQRLGEMEVWALEGFGAAYTLQELLTMKSDDIEARHQVIQGILERKAISIGTPESFKVLLLELQSLCLHIGVYSISNTGNRQRINSDYLF